MKVSCGIALTLIGSSSFLVTTAGRPQQVLRVSLFNRQGVRGDHLVVAHGYRHPVLPKPQSTDKISIAAG